MLFFFILSLINIQAYAQNIDISFSKNVPKDVQNNAHLIIEQRAILANDNMSEYRKQQLRHNIATLIQEAAQPYGYFSSHCQVDYIESLPSLKYHAECNMGPPIIMKHVSIQVNGPGKSEIERLIYQKKTVLEPGSQFRTSQYEEIKNHLLEIAYHHGYVEASTSASQLEINVDQHNATANIQLETGPLYRFGKIFIEQNNYNKIFLKSIAPYKENSVFNNTLIADFKESLEATNLFTYVSVLPFAPDKQTQSIPTQIFYEPISRLQYGLGVGYSSDENFFYSATIQRNRLSDKGMRSTVELLNSKNYSYATSTLSIPRTHPAHDYFNIQVGYEMQHIDYVGTDRSITTTLSHVLQKRINQASTLRQESAINYSIDHSKFDNNTENHIDLLYPSMQHKWLFTPPEKNHITLLKSELIGNIKPFITPTNFLKIVLQQKHHQWFDHKKSAIQIRSKQGYITTSDPGSSLPISWYFYTGGAYSVRGFTYNSIGADPSRSEESNLYLLTASVELQRLLFSDIYGILFLDSGDATEQLKQFKPSYAIGGGILWKTFAGNLEISIAKPIQNHSGDSSMKPRLNINIHQPL